MEFQSLQSEAQLQKIAEANSSTIIFKHNTTCPISKSIKQKLEQDQGKLLAGTTVFILDLISHRQISNAIADKFDIPHQSPQILVIKDGKCIYDEALYNISAEEVAQALETSRN